MAGCAAAGRLQLRPDPLLQAAQCSVLSQKAVYGQLRLHLAAWSGRELGQQRLHASKVEHLGQVDRLWIPARRALYGRLPAAYRNARWWW
jgi:hypothetical protein